jgi:hypothetical protein
MSTRWVCSDDEVAEVADQVRQEIERAAKEEQLAPKGVSG